AAGLAMLRELEETDAIAVADARAEAIRTGWRQIVDELGLAAPGNGVGSRARPGCTGPRLELVARSRVPRPADPAPPRLDQRGPGAGARVLARPSARRRLCGTVAPRVHIGSAFGGGRRPGPRRIGARAARDQVSDMKERLMAGWIPPTIGNTRTLGA